MCSQMIQPGWWNWRNKDRWAKQKWGFMCMGVAVCGCVAVYVNGCVKCIDVLEGNGVRGRDLASASRWSWSHCERTGRASWGCCREGTPGWGPERKITPIWTNVYTPEQFREEIGLYLFIIWLVILMWWLSQNAESRNHTSNYIVREGTI